MIDILFLSCISLEFFTVITLVFSHLYQHYRIWPPKQQNSWQHYLMLFLFTTIAVCIIILGIADWGNYIISKLMRFIGSFCWFCGNFFSIWAVFSLGLHLTMGNEGKLIIKGPYRISRNPQYIGFMLSLIGWAVMTNSLVTFIVSMGACLPLLLAPIIEEPWLLNRFEKDYEVYMRKVPRYLFLK
ncbi:MAG: PEMT/PEM2 methyltransferase family protein [Anaerolineales bacterium]